MSQVRTHYVRPTSAASVPHSLVFVDCESWSRPDPVNGGELQSFRLGVAVGVRREGSQWVRREVIRFTSTFEFWEWAIARIGPKKPLWIFTHNASCDLAWLDVWQQIEDENLRLNVPCATCGEFRKGACKEHHPFRGACVVTDPPVILALKSRNGVVRCIDTMNYWKTSVAKLGRGVGLDKLPYPGPLATNDALFDYCQRDVEIIEKAVCGLLDLWDREQCGHFASTAAGLAWAAFRKTVAEKEILVCHDKPQIDLARAAYYGGQAEAYYIGRVREPVYLYDVRSLYPSIMAASYFPVEFREMGQDLRPAQVLRRMMFDCCVAHCVINTQGPGYPYRIKGGKGKPLVHDNGQRDLRTPWEPDRLGFPTGRYATTLAGPELARSIERGDCEQILSVAWYRQGKPFGAFVAEWFSKRPADVTPETYCQDLLCKTVLNSLSGYWAKHAMRWKDRPELRPLCRWGEWWGIHAQTGRATKYRGIAGNVQELDEPGEARDSCPAISAYITAYGREQMLRLREQCPAGSVYYQDTDGLILNYSGIAQLSSKGLIGDGELGRLRYVGELPELTIHAVKDYEYSGHRVIAGIKEKAAVVGPGRYLQERWESIADQWSRTPNGEIRVREELVVLARTRMARPVGPDGWTAAPTVDTKTETPF